MKNIKHILLLTIIMVVYSTVALCQPKFHTVPKQNMQGININNPASPVTFSLPTHQLGDFNLATDDNPATLSAISGQGYDCISYVYPGFTPVFAHQIVNDKEGNLLFFIVDNYIYNKNGFGFNTISESELFSVLKDGDAVGPFNPYEECSETVYRLHNDIIVAPVPNTCNQFYIFYALLHCETAASSEHHPQLFFKKLTYIDENNIDLSPEVQIDLTNFDDACWNFSGFSMDITNYSSEYENYLLVVQWMEEYNIYEISTNVNLQHKYLTQPPFRQESELICHKRPDAVLTCDNLDNVIYMNSSYYGSGQTGDPVIRYNKFPRDFDNININSYTCGHVTLPVNPIGMEISPNKNFLYFTCSENPGIYYFDIYSYIFNNGEFPDTYFTLNPDGDYSKSQLETFANGKIYAISNDILTEQGTYTSLNNPNNPATTDFNYGCFNNILVKQTYFIDCEEWEATRYIFNHQIDNSDYETGYPIFASDQPDWNTIGSNVTWSPGAANNPFGSESGIVYFDEDFVIPTGKYVKLSNMEFYFANGKKALVNIGSTLRLEGTKLSAETTCTPTAMWSGVYLEGTKDSIQSVAKQGTLSMAAGSEISNAIIGVTVEGGAICKIYAGDFINNKTGIYFYPHIYTPMPNYNAALLQLANFTINGALNNGNTPSYMIYMNGVKGINITSCNFLNSRGSDIEAASRGYAIRSNSTNFKLYNCEVEGWNYGCYSTLGTPRILNNQFAGNFKSVYSASGVSVEITGNDFDGEYNFASGTATPYSVHVLGNGTYNTLYKFEENTIQNGVVGVQFNNLGPNAVKVKDNVFLNISGYTQSCGAVAIGKNSDFVNGSSTQIGEYGLEFRCNNFDDNPYALSVIDGNMRKYQGELGASSGSDYAGNTFDHFGTNTARDFYVKVPINSYWEIPLYQYYSHSDNPHKLIDEQLPLVIGSYTSARVSNNIGSLYFSETHCEETDGGVIIKGMSIADGSEIIEQTDTEIMLKEFELDENTDDGNTYFLLSQAETMNVDNSISVSLDIAELDGYISDEVAITYMQNNSSNQFAKANALLENSPLPASVRNEVDNMEMNSTLKQIVKSQQNGVNNRDQKQIEIANLKQNRGLLISEMYNSAVNNDSVPNEKIALEQFLKNDNNLQSKLHLVNLYRFNHNFEEAGATLNEIKLSLVNEEINYRIEMENYIELEKVLLSIDAGDALLSDAVNANIELINFIAHNESYSGQATAQLLLQEAGIEEFDEIIKLPELVVTQRNASISENTTSITESGDIINVYPNPASEVFYVEYALFNQKQGNTIQILNLNGSVIESYELKQQVGLFVYNKNLSPGTYIIKVGENYTQKLTIK